MPNPKPDKNKEYTVVRPEGERIAKRLARAGLCSRREAERWIADGRVSVDGKILDTPAVKVTGFSKIKVDGKDLPDAEPAKLWIYHKPRGLVTSHQDELQRETVFDKLPKNLGRVISVGRLDINTEGLLLLTNDGALARYLELPSTGWKRRYRVRVHGLVNETALANLKKGITVNGIRYGAIEASLDSHKGTNSWLTITLNEGKNREIRNVMEHLGLKVTRLIRTTYGPFQLGELPRGETKQVVRRVLRDQLGAKATEFGLSEPSKPSSRKTETSRSEKNNAHRRRKTSR